MRTASRPLKTVLLLLLFVLLALAAPRQAEASGLTALEVWCGGQRQDIGFAPDITDYGLDLQAASPLEVTVKARAEAGCELRLNGVSQPEGQGALTLSVSEGEIFTVEVYEKTQVKVYVIRVRLLTLETPPEPQPGPDPQPDPETTTPDTPPEDDPQDSPTAPERTHLILYINGSFLLVNDVYIPTDTAPYLVTDAKGGGYTMVPVRFIAEALGAAVSWDPVRRSVGIELDGRSFELVIGQLVPGTPVAAVIRDSRTFVPLRYVMESFGADVSWTQAEQRVDIYYGPPAAD
ncbi:MAG: copper amine oxidase N-terminal domain-containing protein [Firmicutes bacterium]|nr:copper amine oxidase N-terminal domain-containing protein [Bacillota bacterium]